jgi:hypothetical protein
MSIVMQFTGRFMELGLGISLERLRGRLSSLKLRLVRLLQTGDYALALHRPGRYRPFASAAAFNPGPAYRIGRLKIRMARTVNSVLASSTALSQISYFSSYVRQRIHFGFVGGVSQLPHPLPPSWPFSPFTRFPFWDFPKTSAELVKSN